MKVLVVSEGEHERGGALENLLRRLGGQEYRNPKVSAFALPRAMGVAIRTFDAWMLADEGALTSVLGCAVARQRDPESIRRPKEICQTLLEDGMNPMAQRDMYAEVALRLNLDVLSSRCPKGFKPFAERVRAVFDCEPAA